MRSSFIAEHAREDYERLLKENRERFALRGLDAFAADSAFGAYAVRRDCIETEQMHGRWAGERLGVANADYAKVAELMEQMRQFLEKRQAARPSPAPRQRSGS